jgi:hypothetical protein
MILDCRLEILPYARFGATFRIRNLQSTTLNLKLLLMLSPRVKSQSSPGRRTVSGKYFLPPASATINVCPNSLRFYRMKSLLPAVRRRKHAPSNFSLRSFTYENS